MYASLVRLITSTIIARIRRRDVRQDAFAIGRYRGIRNMRVGMILGT